MQGWSVSYLPPLRTVFLSLSLLFKKAYLALSPLYPQVIGFPAVPRQGKPTPGHEFDFMQFPPTSSVAELETDVVIVGSGCGAGVCAKNLAEKGHRVIVVEKSYHYPASHFPMQGGDASVHLFEAGGAFTTDGGEVSIVAGSAWGGGGTINWSASLQTQGYVRQDWADMGLPFFTSSEFQNSLDRVCHRMGVSTKYIEHNFGNRALLEGARRLGYSASDVPQNTGNQAHDCGYCTAGCFSSIKQGPANSFLPDAARAGARFVEGFLTDKMLFEERAGQKVAVGIKGYWKSKDDHLSPRDAKQHGREVTIRAKRVIVSCGIKIEVNSAVPSQIHPLLPWKSGVDWKVQAARFAQTVMFVIIAREKDTGRIYPDPVDGRIRAAYVPSAFDKNNLLEGIIAAAKIAYAAGAKEIFTTHHQLPSFVRSSVNADEPEQGVNDPAFQSWIQELRQGMWGRSDGPVVASAHQMGTCRMGSDPKKSVVDPNGKVWGTEGLYVADASVFPSASGVNPMVTNMAISDWTSRNIAKELSREAGKPQAKM